MGCDQPGRDGRADGGTELGPGHVNANRQAAIALRKIVRDPAQAGGCMAASAMPSSGGKQTGWQSRSVKAVAAVKRLHTTKEAIKGYLEP